ncbi:MAG: hypothetical protein QOF33_5048 [Thermomicrobiales bacterium]|jgi:hypothetical protein|nr:hypothetical protein [Thermomicrobiales bacterium]
MATVRELHNQAMELAQRAMVEREFGNPVTARELAAAALPFEMQAAQMIEKTIESEPTRSILYQSAGSLAYQAGDFALAKRLVAEGLSGFPPARVEQELSELYDKITFLNHLKVRDLALTSAQVQLSIVGKEVGSGLVPFQSFMQRINAFVTLLDRNTSRLMGVAYQRGKKAIDQVSPYVPMISAPRAGSFSVTVEVAQKTNFTMSYLVSGQEVIDQVMEGMTDVEAQNYDHLKTRIGDESYFVNFVTLAKQLAPDGDRITMVGLTSTKSEVSFTKTKQQLTTPILVEEISRRVDAPTSYVGVLDEAVARNSGRIGLTTEDHGIVRLRVTEGMDDMVRSYFNRKVRVLAMPRGKSNILLEINDVDEES